MTHQGLRNSLSTPLIQAAQRLQVVVPIALLLIFSVQHSSGSLKDGLLVFTGVPFALTDLVVSLWLRYSALDLGRGWGSSRCTGWAVPNGLVMVTFIRKLRHERLPLEEAVRGGALTRLRPVLMTALVASLGLIPMTLATTTGAE